MNHCLPQKMTLVASVLFASCIVGGCATKRAVEETKPADQSAKYASNGDVKGEVIEAPERARYKATDGVVFINPEPSDRNATPNYPPELLEKRLDPVAVVVRVVVDTTGSVESATISNNSSSEQAFARETLAAVKSWVFSPLQRIEGSKVRSLPFSQEYRFTFKQIDGRAVVSSGAGQ